MTCGLDTSTRNTVNFRALYEEGENVSLLDTLVRIGVERSGLSDEINLRRYLKEHEGQEDVLEDIRQCRRRNQVRRTLPSPTSRRSTRGIFFECRYGLITYSLLVIVNLFVVSVLVYLVLSEALQSPEWRVKSVALDVLS